MATDTIVVVESDISVTNVVKTKDTKRGTRSDGTTSLYTSTKITKSFDNKGLPSYKIEIVKYDGPSGGNPTVIGTRDPSNPNKITFNDEAKTIDKAGADKLVETSKTQMNSTVVRTLTVTNSQEREQHRASNGNQNDAENDNDETAAFGSGLAGLQNLQPEDSIRGTRDSFDQNIRYPEDIGTLTMDVIKFDMMKYVPSQFATNSGGQSIGFVSPGRNNNDRSIGSVILPIPGGISDQNQCDWGSASMTALDIAKADIAMTGIFAGLIEGAKKAGDYKEFILQNPDGVKSAAGTALVAAAAGIGGQQLLTRTTGQVLNPNVELLFKQPALRPFSFKFKLSPRSETEAKNVIKIIRFFKQGMAPIRSQSNLFLKSPHTFRLAYLHRGESGELHQKLNAFKECALQGFGVNYTPNGNYATYSDGTMVSYEVTMTFMELEPIFNDEYGEFNDEFIGF